MRSLTPAHTYTQTQKPLATNLSVLWLRWAPQGCVNPTSKRSFDARPRLHTPPKKETRSAQQARPSACRGGLWPTGNRHAPTDPKTAATKRKGREREATSPPQAFIPYGTQAARLWCTDCHTCLHTRTANHIHAQTACTDNQTFLHVIHSKTYPTHTRSVCLP